MIHPSTKLKYINKTIGYGVFTTKDIPEGTIVYVKDSLEQVISPAGYLLHSEEMRTIIDKYSYIDEKGNRIISWDFAKYVNHCCNCNTISTGYGFEIAIRNIKKGEQITDEYGIFNIDKEINLICGETVCRKVIHPDDFDKYYREWDEKIKASLLKVFDVEQPLIPLIDKDIKKALDEFIINPEKYRSVYSLKLNKSAVV